ncbi:ABC transporter permease [Massilibacteroides sp.]|uniref:ABC transporter permease n=1 Tax=Massilibacteroides sp. TaxID=2034766 RepID=UPI00262D95DF|nr:ABC transporter permease [Massilibacteroides sp.]MDD4515056.1 ABC transporter permease [Massilibacteroides sp.]
MSKLEIIIKREYLRRVSKKSFLLLTFLMPILMVAMVFIPLWLSSIKGDDVHNIAVIDNTGKYAALFQDTENYRFVQSEKSLEDYRNSDNKEIYAFLSITDDLLQNPTAATLYSEKQIPGELSRLINQVISKELEEEKMASFNIPNLKEIIKESKINFDVQTIKWGTDGKESKSSSMVASITGMVFTLLIYMFIMIYGGMVMQGVMEEKTNRIVEVIISSVRPFDLMMGKIIGICFVGLTQLFLWGILTTALLFGSQLIFGGGISPDMVTVNGMAQQGTNVSANMMNNPEIFEIINTINFVQLGIFFVLFFIGGYLLYASLFAAIGSSVDSQEDTQQFMMPITVLMIFALYAGIYSMENPDGPLAFWCSLIPLTSPIVMMIRLPFDVPYWQLALSIALLYGTAIGITWLSAKIYRVGILMYGKKPDIKELIKWIKYK